MMGGKNEKKYRETLHNKKRRDRRDPGSEKRKSSKQPVSCERVSGNSLDRRGAG